jgi:hypothetical protein
MPMNAVLPAPADLNPADWEALAQCVGESDRAHTAFLDYVQLGPGRSLAKLAKRYCGQSEGEAGAGSPPTCRLGTLETWSTKFNWQERLAAYKQEQDARDLQLWEQRQQDIRAADWAIGEQLRALAADILAQTPQFMKTTRKVIRGKKGEPDREIITIAIDLPTAIKAIETGSKLQRLAAGMPDSRMEHTLNPVGEEFREDILRRLSGLTAGGRPAPVSGQPDSTAT